MRLVRFGMVGAEKPGVLGKDGVRRDASGHFQDWDGAFLAGGGIRRLEELVEREGSRLPAVPANERWAAPIARPGKVVGVGLNYSDHAKESGQAIPAEPILFLKASQTVVGPNDNILIPRGSQKTDWEVELGVVIGSETRYLDSAEAAEQHIAGYCLSHDVSERAFQIERGGQWTKGKSCDSFNPLGPWLATPDEVADPKAIGLKLWVNGELRQNGTTGKMIFDVPFLIHYISHFMTLEPGDLITTGTPAGVGMGMKPPSFLKHGDVVEMEADLLGRQKQLCVPA
jgi:2,4-didehydro-3-deoxy-L-rhamnonate hydrolase